MPKIEELKVNDDGYVIKLCNMCNQWKTVYNSFYLKNTRQQCKECVKAMNRQRYNDNKEKYYKYVKKIKEEKL